jgi:intein/homing endonuclease
LYQISYEELFCSKLKISTESIKKVKSLSNLSDEERYKAMIYNLTGEHMKALSFNKICEIKKALEFDKSPNENNED